MKNAEPETHTIGWYQGTVEEAFASAKKENKPIFLYWGAVWCPPCQEIKHTVFNSRRFIRQSEAFVPVYLDGDTTTAQLLGEKFGVKGYPTMIIFNSSGTELTRIPGGIDVSIYNDILALSQETLSPTSELVLRVLNAPDTITEKNLKQLAFYSWGQEHNALPDNYSPNLFLQMSELAADKVSRARLYMQYLYAVAEANDSKATTITPLDGAYEEVVLILKSDTLVLACWDSLAYSSTKLLPYIAGKEQQAELITIWQKRLLELSTQDSLSTAEQLGGLFPTLDFYFFEDDSRSLDLETKNVVLNATQLADTATTNSFARQSVVNQINHVLQSAHLNSEAKILLLNELERSKSPYYFMSSLAALAEKQDNIEESIEWYKKAYDSSVGAATRFQWGANYVAAVIRLQPKREEHIIASATSLLSEIENKSNIFAGRNFRTLKKLTKNLEKWQTQEQLASLGYFRNTVNQRCSQQDADSITALNCASII